MALRAREIGILYLMELRSAVRERSIVVNSILVPILLYPFLLWAVFTGMTFVRGQTDAMVSRVALLGEGQPRASVERRLRDDDQVDIVAAPSLAEALSELRAGRIDAVVELEAAAGAAAALADNFAVRLHSAESRERSAAARERLQRGLEAHREARLAEEAARIGVDDAAWQVFAVDTVDHSTQRERGAFILGLTLPLFFVVMVAVGCFYPAVDTTAGERERGTWETLLSLAASRHSIVIAKYLYVLTFGGIAGILNLTAMTFSMGSVLAPLLEREGEAIEFSIPLAALPLMALGALMLAAFVAAGMMLFAAFARTFKEGQSMITPFYLLVMLPLMFVQVPGISLTPALALVPVVNVTLMVREAIAGTFQPLSIALTFGSGVAVVGALLALAAFVLRFEDVMIGSYGGTLAGFLRQRLLGRGRGRG